MGENTVSNWNRAHIVGQKPGSVQRPLPTNWIRAGEHGDRSGTWLIEAAYHQGWYFNPVEVVGAP